VETVATTTQRDDAGIVTCHHYRVAKVLSKDADSAMNSRPAGLGLAGESCLPSFPIRSSISSSAHVLLRLRVQGRRGGKVRRNER
jgi:hypothetical protein